MKKMSTEEIIETRLKTLENDFLQRFGENSETLGFLSSLESMFVREVQSQSNNRFERIISVLKKKYGEEEFRLNSKFNRLLVSVMALERILAADSMRGRGKGVVDDVFLDSQMFERIDAASSYAEIVKSLGLETSDRDALGWGFGGGTGTFTKGSIVLVKKYEKIIEESKYLSELAERIGRHSNSKSGRIKVDGNKPSVSYDGIYNSDNVRTILPSELALNTRKETRTEFLRKLADRQLLCYKPAPDRSAASGDRLEKGPVIICLDTSGSMHGIPEVVSKALTLGIIRHASAEKRDVFIISFSMTFETMRIKNAEDAVELSSILDFLASSFHGGTDIGAAIEYALSQMTKTLAYADVLIVSDFVSQSLSKQAENLIWDAKKRGTRFFALSVGDRGNTSILKLMDESNSITMNRQSIHMEI